MGNSIEIAPSDSDDGVGMYSDSGEDEIDDESAFGSHNNTDNHNDNQEDGTMDEDDPTRSDRDATESEQEASLSSTSTPSSSGTAGGNGKHQRRVAVYVAPMEAAEMSAEKRRLDAARALAAKERSLPMPPVSDYSVLALYALVRFDRFKKCVGRREVKVDELRAIALYGEDLTRHNFSKAVLVEKIISHVDSLVLNASQDHDTEILFDYLAHASKVLVKAFLRAFRTESNAYHFPYDEVLEQGAYSKKRRKGLIERCLGDSQSDSQQSSALSTSKKPKLSHVNSCDDVSQVPLGINLAICYDPFLDLNDMSLVKLFHIKPNSQSTTVKISLPGDICENERITIRTFHFNGQEYIPKWPLNCHLHVNGELREIRNPALASEDLTKLMPNQRVHEVQLCHESYPSKEFAFVIQRNRLYSFDELIDMAQICHYEDCFQFVLHCFGSKKSELQELKRNIPIIDAVSHTIIKTPCRGIACTHISVFDLNVYLQMNFQIPQWQCPVCSQPLPLSDVFVCGYFLKILESVPDCHVSDVCIHANGEWSFPHVSSEEHDEAEEAFERSDIIELSSDEDG